MLPFLSFSFPLLFLFLFSFSASTHHDPQSLLAFKNHITADPHASLADWTPALPFCNWTAVTCSRRHTDRVVSLDLSYMELQGTISPSLANLSFLHTLDLSNNALHGYIPPQLGHLFRLKKLWLHRNQLVGSIPTNLCNCTNLVDLALSYNNLTGSIPRELVSLTHLQELYLGANILTGNIPASLSNISTLTSLGIYENKLTGSVPQELGQLTGLQELYLYENELSGNIPASLSNISTLTSLAISQNKLTGSVPQELGQLSSLQLLYLYDNELSGIIPASFSNISTLSELDISINKLTGSIPNSLSNIFNLSILSLWGNQLSGNIPNSIGNCSKLKGLILQDNKLSGSVPVELGKLSLLEILHLQSNELGSGSATTMPFVVALTNCSSLKSINLCHNKLSGVLPLAIGKLSTNLSHLKLADNMIEGNIPPQIANLSSLTYLNLSRNLLTGRIPSLRNLKQLTDLFLHHNQLSGDIPSNLGNWTNLESLDLSHNRLTGSIPREINELYNLRFYFDLSWNLLEGSLPLEIGKIAMVQAIDISANHLSGVIPFTLGSCVELFSLNLSRNSFQGSIPDSLETLQSLRSLDLSSNSFSGSIPTTLNKLKMLQYLNLSFNKLSGEISKGEFFANQSVVLSLYGNPNLRGPQTLQLSACPTPRGHPSVVKRVVFAVSGVIAFILCCLLLRFLWRGNMHIQNIDFSEDIFQKLKHQRISYQELHIATNAFTKVNILGIVSFGLVYKGILNDGTIVAVKVFHLQNDQAKKSFKKECNILKKVRHRNLVRIITSCSNLHFKGLVFEYMSNGSLEKHLYPANDDNNGEVMCELGLKARLNIAIDVAHAMEYLHHDSVVQVVHCDIKPSNVLLDGDMLGHVTDFGIARLIGENSTNSLTSTLYLRGTVGYIAPEYGLGGTVSSQGDVYSYGILLLEMFTRKRPTSDMFFGDLNLHNWVNFAFPDRLNEVIDSGLLCEVDAYEFEKNNAYKCLLSLLRIGLLCSKHSVEERPTMRIVVRMLESIREDLVSNIVPSRGFRRSMSNLLSNTNATSNGAPTSNEQQSSTF